MIVRKIAPSRSRVTYLRIFSFNVNLLPSLLFSDREIERAFHRIRFLRLSVYFSYHSSYLISYQVWGVIVARIFLKFTMGLEYRTKSQTIVSEIQRLPTRFEQLTIYKLIKRQFLKYIFYFSIRPI